MLHRAFWEAGHRVFGLHPVRRDGTCGCGHTNCKTSGKHPLTANWTYTPEWSEDQLDVMEELGNFATGYGILVKDLLVTDVDARNGGVESYARLVEDHPDIMAAGLIVETGSGGGSKHLYFTVAEGLALVTHLPQYPGIDFKSSGFVVGPDSLHASGNRYKVLYGSPSDIGPASTSLVDALRKPERHRADLGGSTVDVSHEDIADMLSYINPDVEHEIWVRSGMAIHHATGGTGLPVWDGWSAKGSKYPGADNLAKRWHSFGKSANPVTLGTLVYYAQQAGWEQPVTFTPNESLEEFIISEPSDDNAIDISGLDLTRPPGFVGEVAQWIEDQIRYKRETISVGAALVVVGNLIGLKYRDPLAHTTSNLIGFCVAGSATGKDSALEASIEIMSIVGLQRAAYGAIKSEQEVVRNLVENQPTFYIIDEIGFLLSKINNAKTKGTAAYLEGILGIIMSIYSKANGVLLVSGDVRKEIRKQLVAEINQIDRQLEEGDNAFLSARRASLEVGLEHIQTGIKAPFLSILGFTTPVNFDGSVNFENATNGFIGRSMLFIEQDTTPPEKEDFEKRKMEEAMRNSIIELSTGGSFSLMEGRIENYGEKIAIPTTDDARMLLRRANKCFQHLAEDHAERTGLEALYLRAKELVGKISFIIATPSGLRTVEHVRWAYALVKNDVDTKANLVIGNDRAKDSPEKALFSKIDNLLKDKEGKTFGVMLNRLRGVKKDELEHALEKLVSKGAIIVEESVHPRRKDKIQRYRKA